jgi:hypothetical protein
MSSNHLNNGFKLETNDIKKLLRILTVDMMFQLLSLTSNCLKFWKWIDRSQISSKDYLYKSYDMIIDSWTKFKCTGHGAIELGTVKNISGLSLEQRLFGLESKILSQNEVFLKMNIDEYLELVSHLTIKVHGVTSLFYLQNIKSFDCTVKSKHFTKTTIDNVMWYFTYCSVQGGPNSRGSPTYLKIEPDMSNIRLDEDDEINEVLIKKELRKQKTQILGNLQKVIHAKEYFQFNHMGKICLLECFHFLLGTTPNDLQGHSNYQNIILV